MFENAFRIENELLLFENYFDLKAISEVYKDIIDYYDKESNDKLKEYYTEKYKNVLHKLKTNFSSYNIIKVIKPRTISLKRLFEKIIYDNKQKENLNENEIMSKEVKKVEKQFVDNISNIEKEKGNCVKDQKKQFMTKLTKKKLNKRRPSIDYNKQKQNNFDIIPPHPHPERRMTIQNLSSIDAKADNQKENMTDVFNHNFDKINRYCQLIYDTKLKKINNIFSDYYDEKVKELLSTEGDDEPKEKSILEKKQQSLNSLSAIIPDNELLSKPQIMKINTLFFTTIIKYISI